MNEKMIDLIEKSIRDLDLNLSPKNESIFILGIQLGKHIAKSGDDFDRLPFFVECESKLNEVISKENLKNKISKLIGNLFYLACAEQIKNRGAITFSIDYNSYANLHPLDQSISERFFVEEVGTKENEGSESFLIQFKVTGVVADLFKKYEFVNNFAILCENPYGVSNVKVSSLQDLPRYIQTDQVEFNEIRISYVNNEVSATDEGDKLRALFDELSEELLFLHIAHPV
jgi:hypothetical protein